MEEMSQKKMDRVESLTGKEWHRSRSVGFQAVDWRRLGERACLGKAVSTDGVRVSIFASAAKQEAP